MITEQAENNYVRRVSGYVSSLQETDPEFIQLFSDFVIEEVEGRADLDDRTRFMAILATLIGCQGICEFRPMLTPL